MRPAMRSTCAPASAQSRAARSSIAFTRTASKVGLSHSTHGRNPASMVSASNGSFVMSMGHSSGELKGSGYDRGRPRRKNIRKHPCSTLRPSKLSFFDVFGTVVDWRNSIARESEAILKPKGHALDWLAFADAWRNEYRPRWRRCAPGSFRSPSSTCCTGATSIASCRASRSRGWTRPRCSTSTRPGTGLMAGRTPRPGCSGCTRNS